jgi:hypothetical protein
MPIERQDSIAAAVKKKQFILLIDGEPTRIGDTCVIAEGTERPAVAIERKKGSISVAIDTCCACNEERHCDGIPDGLAVSAGTSPRFFHAYRESLRQESVHLNGRHRRSIDAVDRQARVT